jgi:hypothetical protein
MSITPASGVSFDASQFKLQADGTFRISIRGMAAMAGIAESGLRASLKSAAHENPLPCAKSLLAQGFYPAHVSTWGETGGIPEDAAPFILEHYGINATSPSQQARAVLLAFTRVGINAYLKEKLGVSQVRDTQPPALTGDVLTTVDRSINLLERLGGVDDRAQMLLRDVVLNATLSIAGGSAPQLGPAKELTVSEFLIELGCPAHKATKLATRIGKEVKRIYKSHNGRDPKTQPQLVNGRRCDVSIYEREWLTQNQADFIQAISEEPSNEAGKL